MPPESGTSITGIRPWPGWLYLTLVIDLFSRPVVEWTARLSALAIATLAGYIDNFWNRTPRHSHIGGVSFEQFQADNMTRRAPVHE